MIVQNVWEKRTKGPFIRKAIATSLIIFLETYTVLFQIVPNIQNQYDKSIELNF